VASLDECEAAVRSLVAMLAEVEPDIRASYVVDRTVSVRVSDLDVTWSGRLSLDGITELTDVDDAKAQIRLTVGSDDLIALTEGRLSVPTAFATGRIRVQASPRDLLRLRTFL
jgi:predicted lipid carrier protein YhbT